MLPAGLFQPIESEPGLRGLSKVAGHRLSRSAQPRRTVMRMAYLPETEFAAARERNLLGASVHRVHEHYRRELQDTLLSLEDRPGVLLRVVPLEVAGLLAYASRAGKDPASRQTRLDYSGHVSQDHDIAWPPERNAPCWCGSARKYKKCCGAPGFLAMPVPDPASLVLKIELGETTIIDPRSDSQEITADGERLISIVAEPGETFRYVYDFGDEWSHTVTLEEIREAGAQNLPRVLAGSGACPPEDCGGVHGYACLLQAFRDPADPRHREAVDRLGDGFDPASLTGVK